MAGPSGPPTTAVRNIKAKRALAGSSVPQTHGQPSPGTPRSKINCHSTRSSPAVLATLGRLITTPALVS
jgi:hypothetical protein